MTLYISQSPNSYSESEYVPTVIQSATITITMRESQSAREFITSQTKFRSKQRDAFFVTWLGGILNIWSVLCNCMSSTWTIETAIRHLSQWDQRRIFGCAPSIPTFPSPWPRRQRMTFFRWWYKTRDVTLRQWRKSRIISTLSRTRLTIHRLDSYFTIRKASEPYVDLLGMLPNKFGMHTKPSRFTFYKRREKRERKLGKNEGTTKEIESPW